MGESCVEEASLHWFLSPGYIQGVDISIPLSAKLTQVWGGQRLSTHTDRLIIM